MQTKPIQWLAVILSAVLNMLLGFAWYGFLFNKSWMAGNQITMEGEKLFKNGQEMDMSPTPMIVNTLVMFVYPLFMHWLLSRGKDANLQEGVRLGVGLGLIMFISIMVGNLFAANPMSLTLCDGLYSFLNWVIVGTVMGGWRKKAAQA